MANNRFNKQATPKGYKAGGQVKNSKGTSTSTKGNIRHGKLKSQKELKTITDSKKYKCTNDEYPISVRCANWRSRSHRPRR